MSEEVYTCASTRYLRTTVLKNKLNPNTLISQIFRSFPLKLKLDGNVIGLTSFIIFTNSTDPFYKLLSIVFKVHLV